MTSLVVQIYLKFFSSSWHIIVLTSLFFELIWFLFSQYLASIITYTSLIFIFPTSVHVCALKKWVEICCMRVFFSFLILDRPSVISLLLEIAWFVSWIILDKHYKRFDKSNETLENVLHHLEHCQHLVSRWFTVNITFHRFDCCIFLGF